MGQFVVKSSTLPEAVGRKCSIKNRKIEKLFWKILRTSMGNTCTEVTFLKNVLSERPENLLKREHSQPILTQ